MNKRKAVEATIILRYSGVDDEPERRVFRNYPLLPDLDSDLMISVNQLDEATEDLENPFQLQVHIVGTSRGLEELGTYLIALARLDSSDPEPYGSFDDIPLSGGGTIRLLPRRVSAAPAAGCCDPGESVTCRLRPQPWTERRS